MKMNGGFDKDVRKAIGKDQKYAAEYFEELTRRPLPVQLALLRKFLGLTQEDIAKALNLKQTHVSRLEKAGSDHLVSLYEKAAKHLKARVAIVPQGVTLMPKNHFKNSVQARAA